MQTPQQTSIIEQFFSALGQTTFMTEYWPRRACHEHGSATRLPPVFHAPVLQSFEQLAHIYRGPGFFFAGEGSVLQPLQGPALDIYQAGHTVYFGDVAPFVRGSRIFLSNLEKELGVTPGCARFGVFASPSNDGAAVHYDTNDVFSVQLRGRKKFSIAPVRELVNPTGMQYSRGTVPRPFHYPQMSSGFPDPDNAEFESVDMSPGSVLYMPRGTWHYTEASADSVAVSIIVNPPPAVDSILEQVKFTLLQDPRWREPLYGAWSDHLKAETTAGIDRLLQELGSVVASLTPEQIVDSGANLNHRLQHLDVNTRFQVIPTARLQTENDRVQVFNEDLMRGNRETLDITTNEATVHLVEWIAAQRGPIQGQQIAEHFGCKFADITDLLKTLCQGELLMPLWFNPLPEDQAANKT